MKALIKPRSQADVDRNRRIVAEYIRGLVEAAKQIQAEEQRKREGDKDGR
jgi:hypothetical protein